MIRCILLLFLVSSCGALGVARDTGIVAISAAGGSLAGPFGAAVGGGAAYLAIGASEGKSLEEDVKDVAFGGASPILYAVREDYWWVALCAAISALFIFTWWRFTSSNSSVPPTAASQDTHTLTVTCSRRGS